MTKELIPDNRGGKAINLQLSTTLPSIAAACECYRRAAVRLLNPPIWRAVAGWTSVHFMLMDIDRIELHRLAESGDYVRMDFPGLRPSPDDAYDWVQITMIQDGYGSSLIGEQSIGIKLVPCREPGTQCVDAANFSLDQASSTIIVTRDKDKVTAWYYGCNYVPNNSESTTDNLSNNSFVDRHLICLSELQWAALCKGLLSQELGVTI